jgi:hypothetical protein
MKIKVKIRAVYFALLFFVLIFAVILYSNYTGTAQNSIYTTISEVLLGLGFLSILAMLLGK